MRAGVLRDGGLSLGKIAVVRLVVEVDKTFHKGRRGLYTSLTRIVNGSEYPSIRTTNYRCPTFQLQSCLGNDMCWARHTGPVRQRGSCLLHFRAMIVFSLGVA